MPAITLLKSLLMTASGTFTPSTDGQGRTLFKIRYGAGGGGGNSNASWGGGGQGQILETDWMEITSAVTVTIGAGGAVDGVGGNTALTWGNSDLVAIGGTVGNGTADGGKTHMPGSGNANGRNISVTTGGYGVNIQGRRGVINPAGLSVSTEGYFTGGMLLSRGGLGSTNGGGGAGGYMGRGGGATGSADSVNGIGYSSGGGSNTGSGKAGFAEFFWI